MTLADVKVGDKLLVLSKRGGKSIEIVERITPTGRVITKSGTFDSNGYSRGSTMWDRRMALAATEDDIAGIYRLGLVRKIEQFRGWDRLSASDLKLVAALVDQHTKS